MGAPSGTGGRRTWDREDALRRKAARESAEGPSGTSGGRDGRAGSGSGAVPPSAEAMAEALLEATRQRVHGGGRLPGEHPLGAPAAKTAAGVVAAASGFSCGVCGVSIADSATFKDHLKGKKHRKREAEAKAAKEREAAAKAEAAARAAVALAAMAPRAVVQQRPSGAAGGARDAGAKGQAAEVRRRKRRRARENAQERKRVKAGEVAAMRADPWVEQAMGFATFGRDVAA